MSMSAHKSPCDALAVDGAVRGAMVGVLWGGFQGTYYGWQDGRRGRTLATNIARSLGANGAGFASFLGLYQLGGLVW
ncbi:hypothetical protein T484DRAFT_1784589 [Baffinella frigidus]|nr:hypothetical protein T484DRAFT_1784589 [Cryptophyta sp. CCMP2293]